MARVSSSRFASSRFSSKKSVSTLSPHKVLTFFLQTVDAMRAQKFCPASFSKSPLYTLLPLPGHAHRAPSMALREKQRDCTSRFPERAAKASRARGPTPQKSQNTREERREIECESDLRGVALHFTWPQTPPAIGGGSSSRNATRSGPLRLARSGALRLLLRASLSGPRA